MNNLNDTTVLNNAYLSTQKADFVSTTITELVQLTPSILTERQRSLIVNFALTVIERSYKAGQPITNADSAMKYCRLKLAEKENETFSVLYLDSQHRLISYCEEFNGTINSATVHCRVIVQHALKFNAAAVIVTHNHPSGLSEPSNNDIAITKKIAETLDLIDVELLDHIVVSKASCTSMKSYGLI